MRKMFYFFGAPVALISSGFLVSCSFDSVQHNLEKTHTKVSSIILDAKSERDFVKDITNLFNLGAKSYNENNLKNWYDGVEVEIAFTDKSFFFKKTFDESYFKDSEKVNLSIIDSFVELLEMNDDIKTRIDSLIKGFTFNIYTDSILWIKKFKELQKVEIRNEISELEIPHEVWLDYKNNEATKTDSEKFIKLIYDKIGFYAVGLTKVENFANVNYFAPWSILSFPKQITVIADKGNGNKPSFVLSFDSLNNPTNNFMGQFTPIYDQIIDALETLEK